MISILSWETTPPPLLHLPALNQTTLIIHQQMMWSSTITSREPWIAMETDGQWILTTWLTTCTMSLNCSTQATHNIMLRALLSKYFGSSMKTTTKGLINTSWKSSCTDWHSLLTILGWSGKHLIRQTCQITSNKYHFLKVWFTDWTYSI
jgi:hypothetical protein